MATVANKNALFMMLVGCVHNLKLKPVFATFNGFVMLWLSHSGAKILRSGHFFCTHDDDDNNATDYFTPCACARGN